MKEYVAYPQSLQPVAITGTGVSAATGDLDAALWGAVATRLCSGRPVAGLSVHAARREMARPYSAPIAALPVEMSADIRIPTMAGQALTRACALLPADRTGWQLLVLTLLRGSSPECPKAGDLEHPELALALRDAHPALAMAQLRFAPADTGAAAHLAACMDELHQGQWDAVLFGGVDSLTDRTTIQALAAKGHCRTDHHPEGTLPGEGAAYLLLQKPDKDVPSKAVIAGLGHALEPNHGKAAELQMTALAAAIEQALGQGQCRPGQVETVVIPLGNDVPAALEWHQVERKLWPEPGDINPEMEELSPQSTIGDTGAAALPLCLVIGCARFEFDFPTVARILVCEAGLDQPRGAVLLKKAATGADF